MSRWIVAAGLLGLTLYYIFFDVHGSATDGGLFIGRFHPTVVHFPIALLLIAALGDILSRINSRLTRYRDAISLLYLIGAIAGAAAVVAGLLLSRGGYSQDLLTWHGRLGLASALIGGGLWFVRTRRGSTASAAQEASTSTVGSTSPLSTPSTPSTLSTPSTPSTLSSRPSLVELAAPVVLLVVITAAGHLGGTLTHGEGYLTRHAPDGLRRIAGLVPKEDIRRTSISDPEEQSVYEALIAPVFASRCVSCHGAANAKGGLALDSREGIEAGSEDGPVIRAGRSENSDLIKYIWMPTDHPDHMPPSDRPQITVAEAELIRWWIDQGASFDETVADAEQTPVIATLFENMGLDDIPRGIYALDVPKADSAAIAAANLGGLAVTLVATDQPFVDVRCRSLDACLTAEHSALLDPLAQQIASFDGGRSQLDDNAAAVLSQFPHITRIHLEKTAVTDATVDNLKSAAFLEYLNLYGTAVSDASLPSIAAMPELRSVYLWQTQVTPGAAESLRRQRPELFVSLGDVEVADGQTEGDAPSDVSGTR